MLAEPGHLGGAKVGRERQARLLLELESGGCRSEFSTERGGTEITPEHGRRKSSSRHTVKSDHRLPLGSESDTGHLVWGDIQGLHHLVNDGTDVLHHQLSVLFFWKKDEREREREEREREETREFTTPAGVRRGGDRGTHSMALRTQLPVIENKTGRGSPYVQGSNVTCKGG
jgi:hypothetical protein